MKSNIIAIFMLLATTLSVAAYTGVKKEFPDVFNLSGNKPVKNKPVKSKPVENNVETLHHKRQKSVQQPSAMGNKIDVVFVLDTTGSMGGLIQAAKENIWSIASSMAQAQGAPEIRMGLVAYRDRGDKYVTKVIDLSSDLDSMYAQLMDFEAAGGGDGPESVNLALSDAINKVSWAQNKDAYKVVFLVGDAPAHMDYPNELKYPEIIRRAKSKNIVVNAIQCGNDTGARNNWRHIAQLGSGDFFQVAQSGGAIVMTTPFDDKMAHLSKELDSTRLYYGSKELKRKKHNKILASMKLYASSSRASQAKRAAYNTSKSGEANLFGDAELVEDISSGRVNLSSIEPEYLPEKMQLMSQEQQEEVIKYSSEKRTKLKKQISELAARRSEYIRQEVTKKGNSENSLDEKIFRSIKKQAGEKGIVYLGDKAAL